MNKLEKNRAKVYSSIELLPAQIEQGWSIINKANIPISYRNFDNIVVCGMGGSNIGFDLVRHAMSKKINIPIILHADYNLPSFVSKKSLIILSSYSGNTEEVLSSAKKAINNKYNAYIITSGGKLSKMIGRIPGIVFPTDFNPSNQPRWGLGYSIGVFLNLLTRTGATTITDTQLMKANISQPCKDFKALAKIMENRIAIVIAAEHLIGNAHVLCNQLNETADNMAVWLSLPEANHHFMEALTFPKVIVEKNIIVLFLNSNKYSSKIQKRLAITKKVLTRQGIQYLEVSPKENSRLADSLSTLQIGSYLCYHMSVVNMVDPVAIPTVDFFKKQMKK